MVKYKPAFFLKVQKPWQTGKVEKEKGCKSNILYLDNSIREFLPDIAMQLQCNIVYCKKKMESRFEHNTK